MTVEKFERLNYVLVLCVVLGGSIWWWTTFMETDWDRIDVVDAQGQKVESDLSKWDKRLLANRVERDMSMIHLTTDQKVDYTIRFSSSENKVKTRTFNAYVDSDSVWLIEDVPLKKNGRYTLRVRDGLFGENVLKDVRGLRIVDSD